MSLLSNFQKSLKDHHLISKGDTVLIGVSGGSDSMGLLKAFCLVRNEWGLRLAAAHINHQLRKSSDRDERFVSDYCQKNSIPLVKKTVSIDLESRSDSIEQKARDKRLKALFEIARKKHAAALALAHHQDDLAETVLMRVIRGSGLAGLQAMTPKRDFKEARVIRPFLAVSKEEILAFCKEHKVPFRTDPTNRSKKFLRNRIRQELLPLLKAYNPQITRSLAVLAENSAEDYDLLRSEGLKCFKRCLQRSKNPKTVTLKTDKLRKLHPALQKIVLRSAIEELKGDLRRFEQKHILSLQKMLFFKGERPNCVLALPGNICAQKKTDSIVLSIGSKGAGR